MAVKRDIKYLNRDFNDFRNRLIEFSKTYFPNTYNDFTPASPGMLFMEQSAYVGDVLSFYLDNQIQETFLNHSRLVNNLYNHAYAHGYTPKVTTAATVELEIFQQIPSTGAAGSKVPDWDYALKIGANSTVAASTDSSITFLIEEDVDFSVSSSLDPTELTVYEASGGDPVTYLIKKTVNAISATINSTTFTFTDPTQFPTVEISDSNIIGILDITDSDGNIWYEVSNLGQDSVFDSIKNTSLNDPNLYHYSSDAPFLLQTKKVQRRFVTRFKDEETLQLQFGSGISSDTDEQVTPNPDNVGLGLPFKKDKLTAGYSPTNFLFTNTYGIAPSNTTLTVRYLTGGGVSANVAENILTSFGQSNITFLNNNLTADATRQSIYDSVAVNNAVAATGGQDGDSIEEIRQNTLANYQAQLRSVTADDYLLRALSLPAKYGTIAKAFIRPEQLSDLLPGETPSVLNLYVSSYDKDKTLTNASEGLKRNLRTYLAQYRIINDSIRIRDAYVVNIGVEFEIITLPNYNNNEVLLRCVESLQEFFNIDNWQINQPILLRDIYVRLDQLEGVQTVKNITIDNKTGSSRGYSNIAYDVKGATINNTVYPSQDPCIFEVKYPNSDIKGRVVPL